MFVYSVLLLQVSLCHLAAALDGTESVTDSWVSKFFLFGLMYVVIIWPLCIVLGLTVVCCICCKCSKKNDGAVQRDDQCDAARADALAAALADQVEKGEALKRELEDTQLKRGLENDEWIAVMRRVKKSVEDAETIEEAQAMAQAMEEVHAGEEEQAIEMGNVV